MRWIQHAEKCHRHSAIDNGTSIAIVHGERDIPMDVLVVQMGQFSFVEINRNGFLLWLRS